MTNRQFSGLALIAASVLTLVIFIVHPTHVDRAGMVGRWGMNSMTHSIALVTTPMIGFGLWGLAEWLGLDRPVVRLALVFNMIAIALMVCAALASGWITPVGLAEGESFGRLAVAINRAFDRGYVSYTAISMLMNGLSLPRPHGVLKLYSIPAALLPLGWLLLGTFDPQVHSMLILAGLQGSWFAAVGWAMYSSHKDDIRKTASV